MEKTLHLTTKEAYAIADRFAQISSRILDCRIEHIDTLSDAQSDALEQYEDRLDHLVVLFRGYGIQLIGTQTQEAVAELTAALDASKERLKEIGDIQKSIKLAALLVELAGGVLSQQPKAVLSAAKNVKEALGKHA